MFKAILKYFGRLKEAEQRIKDVESRLKIAKRQIVMQCELIDTLHSSGDTTCKMMAAALSSLNHHMQRGEEWHKVYQWHLDNLTDDVAAHIPKYVEQYKAIEEEKGEHVNYDTNPIFDFPLKPGEVYVRPRDRFHQQIRGVITVKDPDAYIPPKKD